MKDNSKKQIYIAINEKHYFLHEIIEQLNNTLKSNKAIQKISQYFSKTSFLLKEKGINLEWDIYNILWSRITYLKRTTTCQINSIEVDLSINKKIEEEYIINIIKRLRNCQKLEELCLFQLNGKVGKELFKKSTFKIDYPNLILCKTYDRNCTLLKRKLDKIENGYKKIIGTN